MAGHTDHNRNEMNTQKSNNINPKMEKDSLSELGKSDSFFGLFSVSEKPKKDVITLLLGFIGEKLWSFFTHGDSIRSNEFLANVPVSSLFYYSWASSLLI